MSERDTSRRSERGQSLIELAFVLPLVVLLIFGAIELGRAVYVYNTLANAARQGARVAAVNQRTTGAKCDPLDRTTWSITQCVLNAGIDLDLTASNVTVQFNGASCATRLLDPPCTAQVSVTYTYVPFTPLIGDLVGNISMSSTSQMPVEAWYP